ncbi:RDD family protein [Niveispirillum sp. KHB5.9]|uniref:RDD family protein n=1 Tax=Niveispirillum sp. KHB5.9 TaxID=3400269 RepID=UPI003A858000
MSGKWWHVRDGAILGSTLDRTGDQLKPDLPLPDPNAPHPARPLPRLLAQGVDLMIGVTILTPPYILLLLIMGFNATGLEGNMAQFVAVWILILLALLLQAPMVALTGTTPGKALLGLRLTRLDGTRPDFPTLLKRQARLWVEGLGLGIHLAAPITATFSCRRVMRGQPTRWDAALDLRMWQHDDRRMRHPLAFLAYSALLSVALNLPNPFHALMPDEEGRLYTQPMALSDRWRNPVTGKVGRLATGWVIEVEQLDDGGTAHWFWKQDRDGRGMIRREFIDRPFPDHVAEQLRSIIPNRDEPFPAPVGDQPVCIRTGPFTSEPEEGMEPEMEARHLRGLASGEVWTIQGWWPNGDEPEKVRVQSLLNGLESTLR